MNIHSHTSLKKVTKEEDGKLSLHFANDEVHGGFDEVLMAIGEPIAGLWYHDLDRMGDRALEQAPVGVVEGWGVYFQRLEDCGRCSLHVDAIFCLVLVLIVVERVEMQRSIGSTASAAQQGRLQHRVGYPWGRSCL